MAIAVAVAIPVDRWVARSRAEAARARVRALMAPYADAIEGAVARRMGLLAGLRSFADSRRTRRALDEEFPVFAAGTRSAASGVRAIQLVERGRIVATYPLEGNEAALGYDLTRDPRPEIGGDVRRALESGRVTVTGPVQLVQGGVGLLVRQRLTPRPGYPELGAIILDIPVLVAEAGLPDTTSGLRMELLDRSGTWFGGDPPGSTVAPESVAVSVADGDWRLLGSPAGGWEAMTQDWQRPLRAMALMIIVAAGLLGYVLGARQDRLREEAQAAATRLDYALQAGGMGVWEYDVVTGRTSWNAGAAAILGFRAEDEPDPIARIFARMHPDDRERMSRAMTEARDGLRGGYLEEFRQPMPDGGVRWLLLIAEVQRDEAGVPTRLFGVVSDTTARRQLVDKLRNVQRLEAVGRLAGGVAHDFNNLLTAITGFAELARDRAAELPPEAAAAVAEDLRQVVATADRGAALTQQLLAFSRRAPAAPRRVELPAAIRELEPMLRRLAGEGIDIATDLSPGTPAVYFDPNRLTQVLLNLVVNARDAMPGGGTVTVRAYALDARAPQRAPDAPRGTWACLEVRDHGVGMSPAVRQRIFEPYFTTKEFGRGTGLGLAVVYGAVESAGGSITVETAEGVGTTFRIYLPPLEAAEAA